MSRCSRTATARSSSTTASSRRPQSLSRRPRLLHDSDGERCRKRAAMIPETHTPGSVACVPTTGIPAGAHVGTRGQPFRAHIRPRGRPQPGSRFRSAACIPASSLSAALIALVSVVGLGQYRYSRWTPLQRFYFPAYVRSTILDALGVTKPGRYALLTVMDRRGSRLAVDTDVEATPGSSSDAFTLTAAARSMGLRGPAVTTDRYDSQALHTYLLTSIYQGRRLRDLAWPPLAGGLGVLVLGLVVAIPQDAERARARRQGRRLRAPELVTPRTFRRRLRADGVGRMQARPRGRPMAGRDRLCPPVGDHHRRAESTPPRGARRRARRAPGLP